MTTIMGKFNRIKKAVGLTAFSAMLSTTPIWKGNSHPDNK